MTEPSQAELRAVRNQLLSAADTFSDNSTEYLATLREKSANWPGESGHALRALVEHMTEQDRLTLARVRDLAHHIPVKDTDTP